MQRSQSCQNGNADLHEAFVQQGCRLHIFVHFQRHAQQQSPYAYFLRDIMELNQMGIFVPLPDTVTCSCTLGNLSVFIELIAR